MSDGPSGSTTAPEPPRLRAELSSMAKLAAPLALSQMGMMLMGVVDTAVVSRFDPVHAAGTTLHSVVAP